MIVQIKRIILLLGIIYFPIQTAFSQHSSKNNYTGAWETPTSWSPTWAVPQTVINPYDITINGYITVNGSLSFSGTSDMIINDTLVIIGDLSLNNNSDLTINNNAILIVRGTLYVHNHSEIIANGYLIITDGIDKHGPNSEGSVTSNDNPVKVFVGGTISPGDLTDNEPDYPGLNCTAPVTIRYPHSNCSYGDMTDIITDPIYSFFQSTCTMATPTITAGGPTTFCPGGSVTLTSSAGTTYLWSTGATTSNINVTSAGSYTVKVTNASGCLSAASAVTAVTINTLPVTPIITFSGPNTFCPGGSVTLTSSAGTTYLWSTGATTSSITVTAAGSYNVKVTNASGCQSAASTTTTVTVSALPATPIITAGGPTTFCAGGNVTLTSSPGTTYLWSTGATTSSINVTAAGSFTLKVTNASGCQSATSAATIVIINNKPVAIPGPDQELKFVFETQMKAVLSSSEKGEWSLISGAGHITDIHSPITRVTELSIGDNMFLWKVENGNCEDSAKVKITVFDLIVPSVITPDGDGKNDCFKISEFSGKVELIIFNRWGNEEYTNGKYLNDWDGRNSKGAELPNDTYFYVLKFNNGKIIKGSVLIKR